MGVHGLVLDARHGEFGDVDVEVIGHQVHGLGHIILGEVLACDAQELLGAACDGDVDPSRTFSKERSFGRKELDGIADEVTPGAGAGGEQQGVIDIFLHLLQRQGFRMFLDVAVLVEVLLVERHELEVDAIIDKKLHHAFLQIDLVGDVAFRGQITLDIDHLFAKQAFEALLVRREGDAAVDIDHQIRPKVVDGLQLVFLDDAFQQDLHPCRYTHNDADIPGGSGFHHLVEFLRPVFNFGDTLTGLVEELEPLRDATCRDAREVAGIITAFTAVRQVGAATDHQHAAVIELLWEVVTHG